MTLRYEGVRFSDGSCAIRRIADDPCDRATLTFESMRELEEDVGSVDVVWLADRGAGSPEQTCTVLGCSCALHPRSFPSFRPHDGWQLFDLETGQELRPGMVIDGAEDVAIVELQPGEQPVPPPDGIHPTAVDVSHRVATIVGDPPRPAYVGDGHPEVRRARYERTEEADEP